jgi:hypothetical protein
MRLIERPDKAAFGQILHHPSYPDTKWLFLCATEYGTAPSKEESASAISLCPPTDTEFALPNIFVIGYYGWLVEDETA